MTRKVPSALLATLVLALPLACDTASNDADADIDADTDTDADSDSDTDTTSCTAGAFRCARGMLQRCTGGEWEDWDDCAAKGMACGIPDGGEARCCATEAYQLCYEDNVHWSDECGNAGALVTDCVSGGYFCVQVEASSFECCGGPGRKCSSEEPPEMDERMVTATADWLGQDEEFTAYGQGNVYWVTDGQGLSIRAADPAFGTSNPRRVTLDIELFEDADGGIPACALDQRSLPLCFEIGADGGAIASIEDGTVYYVTEEEATGHLEILGRGSEGALIGTFSLTAYRRSGSNVLPDQAVVFTKGKFHVPRKNP